jgi:hypothetical protein
VSTIRDTWGEQNAGHHDQYVRHRLCAYFISATDEIQGRNGLATSSTVTWGSQSVRQKKTGRPVRFELTEATRQAIDDYLKKTGKTGEYLFTGRRGSNSRPDHLAIRATAL